MRNQAARTAYMRKYRKTKSGLLSARRTRQKRKYGAIPPEASHCEACGVPFVKPHEDTSKRGVRCAFVDHDHADGRFRGFLCQNCNLALGHVKDSRDRLQLLINYLDRAELLK